MPFIPGRPFVRIWWYLRFFHIEFVFLNQNKLRKCPGKILSNRQFIRNCCLIQSESFWKFKPFFETLILFYYLVMQAWFCAQKEDAWGTQYSRSNCYLKQMNTSAKNNKYSWCNFLYYLKPILHFVLTYFKYTFCIFHFK